MSPMMDGLGKSEVFCLDEACSLEGVEKEVSCLPNCLLEPSDGAADEVARWRLLLCRSDMFALHGSE